MYSTAMNLPFYVYQQTKATTLVYLLNIKVKKDFVVIFLDPKTKKTVILKVLL